MITVSGVYRRERDMSFWQARTGLNHDLVRELKLSLDKTKLEPVGAWVTPSVSMAVELVWYGPASIMDRAK